MTEVICSVHPGGEETGGGPHCGLQHLTRGSSGADSGIDLSLVRSVRELKEIA